MRTQTIICSTVSFWAFLFSPLCHAAAKEPVGRAAEPNANGLECQLRPDKVFLFEGETPTFKVGLRNRGTHRWYVILEPAFWELSVDGKWYHMISCMAPEIYSLPPGRWYDDITFSASKSWVGRDYFSPGVHVIRVAFFASPTAKSSIPPYAVLLPHPDSPAVRVTSNPVEIKILPKAGGSPETGVFFQWWFILDKEIPVHLKTITARQRGTVSAESIKFRRIEGRGKEPQKVKATLKMNVHSWPKFKWRTRLQLLDQEGDVVAEAQEMEENSGRLSILHGGNVRKKFRRDFSLGSWHKVSRANRFRVSFEPLYVQGESQPSAADNYGWGKSVTGLQCRLRRDAPTWLPGQIPSFKADVRNRGSWGFSIHKTQDHCQLCIDGQWYKRLTYPSDTKTSPLEPPQQYQGIIITLDEHWCRKTDHQPLTLAPGKHTVQLAFSAKMSAENPIPPTWFLSNPVEIKISPEK